MSTFKTPKGTELALQNIQGKPYLGVQQRVQWFCEEHPDWRIETNIINISEDSSVVMAVIKDANGNIMRQAHKQEHRRSFADHLEKAETGSIGRALGLMGYGTQFALEFEEGSRIVDSPVPPKNGTKPASNSVGPAPSQGAASFKSQSPPAKGDPLPKTPHKPLEKSYSTQATNNAQAVKAAKKVTEGQIGRLWKLQQLSQWSVKDVMRTISETYGIDDPKELSMLNYDQIIDLIQNHPPLIWEN